MYAINLDSTNRILRATSEEFKDADSILVDALPTYDTADIDESAREYDSEQKRTDITSYKRIDGKYIYSPLPDTEPPEPSIDMELVAMQVAYTALMTDTEL